jgi:aminopeptidase
MSDIRLQRMAHILVHYSLRLKHRDRLAIDAGPAAAPLVREVVREALRAGAYPEPFVQLPGIREIQLQEASDEQLRYIPAPRRLVFEEYETFLSISAEENTKELNGIDPARIALAQRATYDLHHTFMQRGAQGSLRWCSTLFPTNAYAQDADMSLHDFEEFVYQACFLNDEDPVACWQELSRQQQGLIEKLRGKHEVHIVGPETDLTLSVAQRTFINSDGKRNFPSGEIFTSPIENSANGYIHFSLPASYNGRSIEHVRLRFENGVVVEATAARGQDYLHKMLSLDEGARRLGEFAFGNNRNVQRCTKNILFDEKIGGTVHLALGRSYPETGGVNQSSLHWDMVCDLRSDGEVRVDGEVFSKNGEFV